MKMFRLTLRELLLIAVIVCLAVGWMRDRYRLGVLVDVAENYKSMRQVLRDYDDEENVGIKWHGDSFTIYIRGKRASGSRYPAPPSNLLSK